MNKKILISILFFIIILQPVYSISLAHGPLRNYFEPNEDLTVMFKVMGAKSGTKAEVHMEGELAEFSTITEPDENGYFKVTIHQPAELSPPGPHSMAVIAREVPIVQMEGMIATLTRVRVPILVIVPFEGKYLLVQAFSATDANIGEEVNFLVEAISWGTETISSASAKIDIFNPDGVFVTSVDTNSISVDPEQKVDMKAYWDTTGMIRGIYSAKATTTYDGETKTSDTVEFRVGELLVSLVDYTGTIETGGLKPMAINVKSEWSGLIENIYAIVELGDYEFKTAPVDLGEFKESELVAYIDTDKYEVGQINGKLIIYYGADKKTTIEDITVTFVEPENTFEFNYTYLLVIGLIIIIFIMFFLFLRKGKKRKK